MRRSWHLGKSTSPGSHDGNLTLEAGGDIKGKGPQELVEKQTAGDLSPGMLLGTAHVHLASVPRLPIKIKEIDFLLFASED